MSKHERVITLDGPMNFRDLGGYQTQDGRAIKWGTIYRADDLSRLSHHDRQKLSALNITVDCDLRSSFEQMTAPDRHWSGVKYVDAHVYAENGEDDEQLDVPGVHEFNDMLGNIYQHVLLNVHSQLAFKQVLHELLNLPAGDALVFHCSAGKDRTGMVSALIMAVLGVDDNTIIKDYLLTNQLYSFAMSDQLKTNDELSQMIANMNVTKGDGPVMKGFLQTIHDGWGSAENLFTQRFGFTAKDIEDFRNKFLV
ncbi:tyrosine-protein phosphatase [Limosilactobacillus secaliphilus]|nr:tyrosine-protein phosphatase [Limosilactobacillus secaliphilus]